MHRIKSVTAWLLLFLFSFLAFAETSQAQVSVRGYYRKDGTYVAPHYRSRPDGNFYNNWSTKGNVNPYTGKAGTKISPSSSYGQDVKVDGYFRQDGTYVPSHYRSAPDGDLSNNWSTNGNVNPYTGKPGTNATPPAIKGGLTSSSLSGTAESSAGLSLDERNRIRKADELKRLGFAVDWQSHSYVEMIDMADRIRKANELMSLGFAVNWRSHSYVEMIDMTDRIRKANELERMGYKVNWRDYTYLQLIEFVSAKRRRAG